MWMPQYQTYYAINFDHHAELWGGQTFNKLLVLEYPDSNLVCAANTDAQGAVNIDFLYPLLVQSKYFLDGMLTGHCTFYNTGASGSKNLLSYTASLNKLSSSGNITTLGSMTYTFPSAYSMTYHTYLTVPIFIQLTKAEVDENEKLFLRLSCTQQDTLIFLSHANDSSCPDIKISVPYAPTG